jgi:hypothetical protein
MSQSVRQSNLFSAEDWQTIYKSFSDVDFRAYDFDTLRTSLIDYVRAHYPEDFNDYIQSSEFVATIELLAYIGTSLNFRADLNTRENFLDTAERRDSIIRLARLLSYTPKRNIALSGLFKLSGVETNEPVQDSLNRDLNNVTIFWNDANNPDSFEQFTTILNSAFNSNNPFGRPFKTGTVGDIPTDLYRVNNVPNVAVSYNINIPVRGDQYPFDIVNPDFNDGEFFFERPPNPADNFHVIYRNDSQGLGSSDTGFFLLFKQGTLQRQDTSFDLPVRNRTLDININNVNENDVYVQEINGDGDVLQQWTKVPSLVGTNVIYNSLDNNLRTIFNVLPRLNDQITLKFADGNFGDTPIGIFRTWLRVSANRNLTLRPADVQNFDINVPYYGADGQEYNLRLIFSLDTTVANGAPSETNDQIKERAPQVFYTQNRMVNGEDYNVFPLTRGNEIAKIKAVNRTHAGHSRYIDINDPTGTAQNVLVFGDDAAVYEDEENNRTTVSADIGAGTIVNVNLDAFIDNQELANFFYTTYREVYLGQSGNTNAFNITSNPNDDFGVGAGDPVYWQTQPRNYENDTGFLSDTTAGTASVSTASTFFRTGAQIRYGNASTVGASTSIVWRVVNSLTNDGVPSDPEDLTETGPIELSDITIDDYFALDLIPTFRTAFDSAESTAIQTAITNQADFGIGYDVGADSKAGAWYVIDSPAPSGSESFEDATAMNSTDAASWLIFCSYDAVDDVWTFRTRGKRYIFESKEDVRFFFDPTNQAIDVQTGLSLSDELEILRTNTLTNPASIGSGAPLDTPIKVTLTNLVLYEDGYKDPRKVEVIPTDTNADGVPDEPLALSAFIDNSGQPQDVYFERFTDFDGYEYFRLWEVGRYDMDSAVSLVVDLVSGSYVISASGGSPDPSTPVADVGLILTANDPSATGASTILDSILNPNTGTTEDAIVAFDGMVFFDTSVRRFYVFNQLTTTTGEIVQTTDYDAKIGRTFELDTLSGNNEENPLYFKWKHYAPRSNRVDPSISNIIDTILLTNNYYSDVITWKGSNDITAPFPDAPTTEDLRIQFLELNEYKMLSDQIIYQPGKFKLLFGNGAEDELRAKFKVVKVPGTTVTDNEVKSEVISAIDEYFDINNWDFGESFFYTELSAYIHQKLAKIVASVVIVPQKDDSVFGNLFQVKGEPDELFLSTATVGDVDIVRNLTDTNLRIGAST